MRENRSYIWLPGKGGKRNRWGRSGAPLAARRPLLRVGGWETKLCVAQAANTDIMAGIRSVCIV